MNKKIRILGMILCLWSATGFAETITGKLTFTDNPTTPPSVTINSFNTGTTAILSTATYSADTSTYSFTVTPGIYDIKVNAGITYNLATRGYVVVNTGADVTDVNFTMGLVGGGEVIYSYREATVTGGWSAGTSGDYVTSGPGDGSKKVTWTPNITKAGTYEVYAGFTTGTNRATNVPYNVKDAGGITTPITVSQQSTTVGLKWFKLGNFQFNVGTSGSIEMTDNANGYIIAQSIKLVDIAPILPPNPPQNIATKIIDGAITLNWSPPAGGTIIAYRVYRSATAGSAKTNATNKSMPIARDITETSWKDPYAGSGKWYFYAVTAVDDRYQESSSSLEVGEVLSLAARVECSARGNKFSPAQGQNVDIRYTVQGLDSGIANVRIYNTSGELVKALAKNKTVVKGMDNSELWDGRNEAGELVANGLYIAHISVNGVNVTRKIVVIK